eukprot:762719-Hanusia_phi.AAC.2
MQYIVYTPLMPCLVHTLPSISHLDFRQRELWGSRGGERDRRSDWGRQRSLEGWRVVGEFGRWGQLAVRVGWSRGVASKRTMAVVKEEERELKEEERELKEEERELKEEEREEEGEDTKNTSANDTHVKKEETDGAGAFNKEEHSDETLKKVLFEILKKSNLEEMSKKMARRKLEEELGEILGHRP